MASTSPTPEAKGSVDAAPPALTPNLPATTTEATNTTADTKEPGSKETAGGNTAHSQSASPRTATTSLVQLWHVAQAHSHPEIWGVTLADPETHIPTQIILQKYLNANDGDLENAKSQLTKTLDWRAQMKPLELVKKSFSKTKFGSLGFVSTYPVGETKEIINWNIYGGVKSIDETFGNLNE